MHKMRITPERLLRSLDEMGAVGAHPGRPGRTRLTLSDEDRAGRDLFVKWLREERLDVVIDPIGNICGVRPGRDPNAKPIVMGSHLDTVCDAGAYDGAFGVLAGLEVIRTLNDHGVETQQPVAVAAFTNEEGARFQPDMMGSLYVSGLLDIDRACRAMDDDGISVREELDRIGYSGKGRIEASAYLELHVEQGPVLDREKIQIGIVRGIQGISWWYGHFGGEANHAGTTPLEYRKDALLAASDLCCELRALALELGSGTVATMGRIRVVPDVVNVIPSEAFFTIDFRQYDDDLFERGKRRVEDLVRRIAEKHCVPFELEQKVDALPVRFLPFMTQVVERAARGLDLSTLFMPSGAGHDAQFMHRVCPTAMIFVPSIGGRSHCPEERTEPEDLVNGANVLLRCVLEIIAAS